MTRPDPKNHMKSFVVKWKGTDPKITESTWAPGYTPGHRETRAEALAAAMDQILSQTAEVREKWIKLMLAVEQERAHGDEHDRTMDMLQAEGRIMVTETDDLNETMEMPDGAVDIEVVTYAGDDIPPLKVATSKPDMSRDDMAQAFYDDEQDH